MVLQCLQKTGQMHYLMWVCSAGSNCHGVTSSNFVKHISLHSNSIHTYIHVCMYVCMYVCIQPIYCCSELGRIYLKDYKTLNPAELRK